MSRGWRRAPPVPDPLAPSGFVPGPGGGAGGEDRSQDRASFPAAASMPIARTTAMAAGIATRAHAGRARQDDHGPDVPAADAPAQEGRENIEASRVLAASFGRGVSELSGG